MHPLVAANPDLFSLDVPAQPEPQAPAPAETEATPAKTRARRSRKAEGATPAKPRSRKAETADGETPKRSRRRKTDDEAPATKTRARRAPAKSEPKPEPKPEDRPEVLAVAEDTARVLETAIQCEMERHPKKGRRRVEAEQTEHVLQFGPKYARELISSLMALADKHLVQAVPRPVAGTGKYGKGAEVVLIGLKGDITRLTAEWERAAAVAIQLVEGKFAPEPVDGEPLQQGHKLPQEDAATFRSSLLLGFRLGLINPGCDRARVEATVRGENGPQGVAWKSTGSGSWFGFETALRLVTLADEETPAGSGDADGEAAAA